MTHILRALICALAFCHVVARSLSNDLLKVAYPSSNDNFMERGKHSDHLDHFGERLNQNLVSLSEQSIQNHVLRLQRIHKLKNNSTLNTLRNSLERTGLLLRRSKRSQLRRSRRNNVITTSNLVSVKTRPSCRSHSQWTYIQTAQDVAGNVLRLAPFITEGGTSTEQVFYETYCRDERSSCLGTDNSQYYSYCVTKHTWVYGKVQRPDGDAWVQIKIKASCNCGVVNRAEKDRWNNMFTQR